MDINTIQAAQRYTSARPATEADAATGSSGMAAADLARSFATTLQEGENLAQQAMAGQADPHAMVQALAQTELAVETAVTVRNKVVEAYQEILRMPV